MKLLIPAPRRCIEGADPLTDYPEDVKRVMQAAVNLGYRITPRDALELWQRHADDLRASWGAVVGTDQAIVSALLKHAEVLPDMEETPAPPEGYGSWLDFAVDTMDTRAEEQDRLWAGAPVSRQAMHDAVRAELVMLRRKAGDGLPIDDKEQFPRTCQHPGAGNE